VTIREASRRKSGREPEEAVTIEAAEMGSRGNAAGGIARIAGPCMT
jgi:hypothetical protein